MSKVGILLISTGNYDIFLDPLIESLDKYFLTDHEKQIYLFSDKLLENSFYVPTLRFPFPTLYRYKWFTQYHQAIDADILYYLDVDMKVVAPVGDEVLPDESGLVAVRHPGYWRGGWGDHGTTKKSLAYVPVNERKQYYAGGFQGGTRDVYLAAAAEMADNIRKDGSHHMAQWHDESHWNKYLTKHTFKELSPSYCHPEAAWAIDLPFEAKIKALDKNHSKLRT